MTSSLIIGSQSGKLEKIASDIRAGVTPNNAGKNSVPLRNSIYTFVFPCSIRLTLILCKSFFRVLYVEVANERADHLVCNWQPWTRDVP